MARLARIDDKPPSRFEQPTSSGGIERLTLPDALQRVIAGTLSPEALYAGAPKELCEVLDAVSREAAKTTFVALTRADRVDLCKALLAAMTGTPGS